MSLFCHDLCAGKEPAKRRAAKPKAPAQKNRKSMAAGGQQDTRPEPAESAPKRRGRPSSMASKAAPAESVIQKRSSPASKDSKSRSSSPKAARSAFQTQQLLSDGRVDNCTWLANGPLPPEKFFKHVQATLTGSGYPIETDIDGKTSCSPYTASCNVIAIHGLSWIL